MAPLSLWEMLWQLGALMCICGMMLLVVGIVVFIMFKPLAWLDNLGRT